MVRHPITMSRTSRRSVSIQDLSPSLQAINPRAVAVHERGRKRAQNMKQGAAAKENGQRLEDQIAAELSGCGFIEDVTRCDAKVHATSESVLWREASGCDFLALTSQGRGIALECKSTSSSRGLVFASEHHAAVARRARAPHITPRQREQLDAYQRTSVALLVVRFGATLRVWPWRDVAKLESIGVDSPGAYLSTIEAMERLLNERDAQNVLPA